MSSKELGKVKWLTICSPYLILFRKFARVVVDNVKDSGEVQFHGVDDGTRVKADNWRKLRYVSAALMKLPPLCVLVRLERSPPPETESSVKIKYLYRVEGSFFSSCLSHVK